MDGEKTQTILPKTKNNSDLIAILGILGVIFLVFFLLIVGSVLFYKFSGLEELSLKLNPETNLNIDKELDYSLNTNESVYDPMDEYTYEDYLRDNSNVVDVTEPENTPVYDYAPPEDYTYDPDPYCYTYDHSLLPPKEEQCFDWDTYLEITDVLIDYDSALFREQSAQSTMDFTCDSDSEIFKKSCNDAKDRKNEAKEEIEYFSSVVKSLIN